MKTSFALLVLALAAACSAPSSAQTSPPGIALQNSPGGYAHLVPFAPVTVCAASDLNVPCTNKAATYTDQTLGTACSLSNNGNQAPISGTGCNNPGVADANGNYTFFAPAGNYRVCVYAQNYQCGMVGIGGGASSVPGGASTQVQVNNAGVFGGLANAAPGSVLASQGVGSNPAFQTKPFLDARDYSGSDMCAQIVAAMNANLTVGGTIIVPAGTYVCTTQLLVPNNSGSGFPQQPSFRVTGVGGSPASSSGGASSPNGGTILDLQNNAATAKIDTRGQGYLEIDHLTLQDSASDCASFLFTTNTVLHVHDVRFNGTSTNCNDAIILGGTGTTINGTSSSPFQGYGTVIRDNQFQAVQRAVLFQTFANNVQFVDNAIWSSSGFATGGAIEINPNGTGQADIGNVIAGNLIECTKYKYGVWVHGSGGAQGGQQNYIAGNSCFDTGGTTVATYRFETGSDFNLVISSYSSTSGGNVALSDADGLNTFISPAQSVNNVIPQPWVFTNALVPIQIQKAGGPTGAYDLLNTTNNDEIFQSFVNSGNQQWQMQMKPLGATAEGMFNFIRTSTTSEFAVGKASDSGSTFIEPKSNTSDLRLRTLGTGQVVWGCGGNAVCDSWFDNSGTFNNTVLVQGKRFGTAKATNLVTGDFTLGAGWGNTASPTLTVTTSRDQAWTLTITTGGTGIAANPTLQITFHDGSWNNVPVCRATQTGGNDITSNMSVTARSATSYTWQWTGTPTTGKTYEITADCWGT